MLLHLSAVVVNDVAVAVVIVVTMSCSVKDQN